MSVGSPSFTCCAPFICAGMSLYDPALNSIVKNSFTSGASAHRVKIDVHGRTHELRCQQWSWQSLLLLSSLAWNDMRSNLIPKQTISLNTDLSLLRSGLTKPNLHIEICGTMKDRHINDHPKWKWSPCYSSLSPNRDMVDVLPSSMWYLMWWASTSFAIVWAWRRPAWKNA